MSTTSKATRAASKVSVKRLATVAGIDDAVTFKDLQFRTCVAVGSSLSSDSCKSIWDLWEKNMRTLMEPSSFGWNPEEKREELFHTASRFILLHRKLESESDEDELVAFTTFRFELGYEDDDVVYCYELQVAERYRGYGIGRYLMDKLTLIGKHCKMEKILLTVLKENVSARKAYERLGFVMDTSSLDYVDPDGGIEDAGDEGGEDCDYEILAKLL